MPSTVVLIHGLWMTPLSWEGWAARFQARGLEVIPPTWPRMDRSVEELRADPSPVAGLGVEELVNHHASLIDGLAEQPIIIGHSIGGLVTQLLLDRGYGAAGVALHPGQTKGVYGLPPVQLRAAWPVLKNPANRKRGIPLTEKQFHYGFANALSREESDRAWKTYHVPAPGRPLLQAAFANFNPKAVTAVDYRKPDRAPLLMVSGSLDRIVPTSVVRENARRYKNGTVEHRDYEGRSHFTAGEPGWEAIADDCLDWAIAQSDR